MIMYFCVSKSGSRKEQERSFVCNANAVVHFRKAECNQCINSPAMSQRVYERLCWDNKHVKNTIHDANIERCRTKNTTHTTKPNLKIPFFYIAHRLASQRAYTKTNGTANNNKRS